MARTFIPDCGLDKRISKKKEIEVSLSLLESNIPDSQTPIRTVRLSVHFMLKDDASGNFPEYDPLAFTYLDSMMGWMNGIFANLQPPTIPAPDPATPPTDPSVYVPDSRIRFRVTSVHWHKDTVGWAIGTANYCGYYNYNKYGIGRGRDINLFLGGTTNPSDQGGGCGDPGGYMVQIYNAIWAQNNYYVYSAWGLASLLAHELGHNLGLPHTFSDSFTDTFWPDTKPASNAGGQCNSTNLSNNIMGYNWCRNYLSPQQLGYMHTKLRSSLSRFRDIKLSVSPVSNLVNGYQHGVFGVDEDGDLVRGFFDSGMWITVTIPQVGGRVVPGSLVSVDSIDNGRAYGINDSGELISTKLSGSILNFQVIGGQDLVPGSLVNGFNNGLFAVNTDHDLVHIQPNSSVFKIIPGLGTDPTSLISTTDDGGRAYGINASGEIVGSWVDANGSMWYGPIAGLSDLHPDSLVNCYDNGLFAIRNDGEIVRAYWSGQWQFEIVPHWGAAIVPHSTIGFDSHDGGRLYAVNSAGEVVGTWLDAGTVTFSNLPGGGGVVAGSLISAHSIDGDELFGVLVGGGGRSIKWSFTESKWIKSDFAQTSSILSGSLVAVENVDGKRTYGINKNGDIVSFCWHL